MARTGPARGLLVIANWRDLEHPEAGGAEVVCQELARRFAAQGREVVHLSASVVGKPREEVRDGYRMVRGGGRFTVYAYVLVWLLRHRSRISGVVDSQNGIPFFTPLAVSRTTPVLLLLHHIHQDQFAAYFPRPVAALGRWLESTASRAVYQRRGIVTVSPSTRTGARRRLGLRGDIWVAPPGWSVTEVGEPVRSQTPTIVCVGRLVPHKRTELVVEAFARVLRHHPEARLTVVGRGPEAEPLRRLAGDLGIADEVSFRADLDDEQRDQLLATAWFSVNASEGEGWGLSVVEANALGVPVMAYRRPGLRDSIVSGETGWLLDDADDLAHAMVTRIEELADPVYARKFADHARAWADRFTWVKMTDRVGAALESERVRIGLGTDDRRARSDVATLVTIPLELLPATWSTRVRDTDVWDESGEALTVLCRGADTQTVEHLLRRLGVEDSARRHPLFAVAVARTSDLLRTSASIRSTSA